MKYQEVEDLLRAELDDPLTAAGVDLEGLSVKSSGHRLQVQVLIDMAGGVSLDKVAEVSRAISDRLDQDDVLDDRSYVLQVSSPGVERPLTLPRHWRRNRDRLVRLRLHAGGKPVVGRVLDSDEESVLLQVGDVSRRVDFSEIERATVQVELNPGGRSGRTAEETS